MKVTAILPVRNRNARRVQQAAHTLLASTRSFDIELIVSDYGSDNRNEIQEAAEKAGARYIFTEADYWNKPVCLNEAIRISSGDYIVCADIDILWHPIALAGGLSSIDDHAVLAFQSRDLPASLTDTLLEQETEFIDWERLEQESVLHSTWGNGILLFPRKAWEMVGGYDERLSIYGVEDLDFCRRAQFSGFRFVWSNPFTSRIYHVWHEKVANSLPKSSFNRALERNRNVWRTDCSVVRNVCGGGVGSGPLVSVIIATKGRAELLRECLASILCQTVQDFEVIVVDDGMLDDSRGVVESFADSRLKYFGVEEPQGISAARNLGASYASGRFVAVMDDDDICLPNRFEVSLRAIGPGVDGCVGGFITFYDDGRVESWDDPLPDAEGSFVRGGFAGHPTWMVRREVFELFPYDESFTSSVDNNIALRMINSGVRLVHTGAPHVLRRVHEGQVTNKDAQFQGFGALIDRSWLWSGYSGEEMSALKNRSQANAPKNRATLYESVFLPNFPDDLVEKKVDAVVYCRADAEAVKKVGTVLARCEVVDAGGELVFAKYRFDGDWFTRARLAQCGAVVEVVSFRMSSREGVRQYVATDPVFAVSVPWRVITEQHPESSEFKVLSADSSTGAQQIYSVESNEDCFSVSGDSSALKFEVVRSED